MELESIFAAIRQQGLDTVRGAFTYDGGEDLSKKGLRGRRRTRLTLADGQVLYLKRYKGKSRWRRSPARVEFDNIRGARSSGVPTMECIVWGEDRERSFLIVTSVPGEALERCLEQFMRSRGDSAVAQVTQGLAQLVRTLHDSGYVHRDLYSCHVFLDYSKGMPDLYLIDLARMFAPRWRKFRWSVKDLAQLKYSMPPAWVKRFWMMFLTEYLGEKMPHFSRYERAIERKVARIYRHAHSGERCH